MAEGRYHRPDFGNSSGEARLGSSYYTGRVAVITGAGSGIGRALAVRLAREGALLALLDRDGPAAEATARQCRDAGTRAWAAPVDVTDREALDTCAAAAVAEFGRIDLVCCAAGVMHTGTVLASAWDDTARVVRVNLLGTMGTVAAFLPALLASGGGHVVLCSSGFGLVGAARYTAYCASKFAVRGFSEALRMEMALGGHDVQVTCAYPGVVRTPIMRLRPAGADGTRPGSGGHLAPGPAGQGAGGRRRGRPRRRAGRAGAGHRLPAGGPAGCAALPSRRGLADLSEETGDGARGWLAGECGASPVVAAGGKPGIRGFAAFGF